MFMLGTLKRFLMTFLILNFSINHEKCINNYLKGLEKSGSLSSDQYKKIKAIGSRPGILYGLCKVHKAITDICPPFRPILSTTATPSYKIAQLRSSYNSLQLRSMNLL